MKSRTRCSVPLVEQSDVECLRVIIISRAKSKPEYAAAAKASDVVEREEEGDELETISEETDLQGLVAMVRQVCCSAFF